MLRSLIGIIFLLTSCNATVGGACQNPVHDACAARAAQGSVEIARIAANNGKTPEEMTTVFQNACEGQLQSDLDQTLTALETIADAGANP